MRQGFWSTWLGAMAASSALLVLAVGGVPVVSTMLAPPVQAEEAAEPADDELAPVEEPAEGQASSDQQPTLEKSFLVWFYEALGIFYSLVFLVISFSFVALLVMNVVGSRRESVIPSDLIDNFETHLNEKQFQEAYELAKNDDSFLGQVLSAGLAKLSAGYPQAIETMQEVGEEQAMRLEHRLSYIGLIGSISPMVGLLGTVHGMVDSFSVIANSPTTPKPSELAQGISTALVTTLVGLSIAIPAMLAFGLLRNRVARLVLEVGIVSEGLMSRFSNVGTKKSG